MKLFFCLLKHAFYGSVFLASFVWLGVSLQSAAHIEADGKVWTAHHEKESERWKSLQAYIALEDKRMRLDKWSQRALYAEAKLAALCKKKMAC